MHTLLFPLAAAALMSGVVLLAPFADATASAGWSSIHATLGTTSAVEYAASCSPKRICGFRRCHYRKVCKRSQGH
jgi:hypothetical protein